VDLAATFVGGGVTVADLDQLESEVDIEFLASAVHWLGYTVETETLINEVCDATSRSPSCSTRRSSTHSWTAPRTSGSTCTTVWTPPW